MSYTILIDATASWIWFFFFKTKFSKLCWTETQHKGRRIPIIWRWLTSVIWINERKFNCQPMRFQLAETKFNCNEIIAMNWKCRNWNEPVAFSITATINQKLNKWISIRVNVLSSAPSVNLMQAIDMQMMGLSWKQYIIKRNHELSRVATFMSNWFTRINHLI